MKLGDYYMNNQVNTEKETKEKNHQEQQKDAVYSEKKNDYPLSFLILENEEENFVKGYN